MAGSDETGSDEIFVRRERALRPLGMEVAKVMETLSPEGKVEVDGDEDPREARLDSRDSSGARIPPKTKVPVGEKVELKGVDPDGVLLVRKICT